MVSVTWQKRVTWQMLGVRSSREREREGRSGDSAMAGKGRAGKKSVKRTEKGIFVISLTITVSFGNA